MDVRQMKEIKELRKEIKQLAYLCYDVQDRVVKYHRDLFQLKIDVENLNKAMNQIYNRK